MVQLLRPSLGCVFLALAALASRGTPVAAQTAKTNAQRSAEKPATTYQVDVRLEVAPDADKSRVLQWAEALRAAGVAAVNEVPGASKPKQGEKAEPAVRAAGPGRVLVVAAIGPAGNLFIGSEGFRLSDKGRLEALVKKLRSEGPVAIDPAAPLWGLTQEQFDALMAALKPAANFELRNKPFREFVGELRDRTKLTIQLTRAAEQQAGSLRLNGLAKNVSLGVALAYVLGQHDLAWEPRQADAGSPSILVLTRAESKRPWPVGLEPEKLPGTVAPILLASARYRTDATPLPELIAIFTRELKFDVLLDVAALAENHLDPAELRSTVQIPGGTFNAAIRKTLAPLGLKHELRIDEADHPFLWVTVGQAAPKKK